MLTTVADVVSLLHTKIAVLHLLCRVYVRIGNIFLSFVPIFFLENKVKVHQYSDVQEVLQEPSAESVMTHQALTIDVVYQALLGCRDIPRHISEGLVLYAHVSDLLSTANTCTPVLTLRMKRLSKYASIEQAMVMICVQSYGFGMA